MPSPAAISLYAFGISTIVFNLPYMFFPNQCARDFLLPPTAAASLKISSLEAVGEAVFYCLAAYQENRAFFKLSVLIRALTASWRLSYGTSLFLMEIWNLVNTGWTAIALIIG